MKGILFLNATPGTRLIYIGSSKQRKKALTTDTYIHTYIHTYISVAHLIKEKKI
jgi:hypothetical protein